MVEDFEELGYVGGSGFGEVKLVLHRRCDTLSPMLRRYKFCFHN